MCVLSSSTSPKPTEESKNDNSAAALPFLSALLSTCFNACGVALPLHMSYRRLLDSKQNYTHFFTPSLLTVKHQSTNLCAFTLEHLPIPLLPPQLPTESPCRKPPSTRFLFTFPLSVPRLLLGLVTPASFWQIGSLTTAAAATETGEATNAITTTIRAAPPPYFQCQ